MTIKHYTNTSYKLSKKLTTAYSTSFSWGIRVFKPEYRDPIFAIYGFVRVADEIVDTFHSHDKEQLLNKFIDDTWEAINIGISTNPETGPGFQGEPNEARRGRETRYRRT